MGLTADVEPKHWVRNRISHLVDLAEAKSDPVFACLQHTLESPSGARALTQLLRDLRLPPYGVRDGMLPSLLAV